MSNNQMTIDHLRASLPVGRQVRLSLPAGRQVRLILSNIKIITHLLSPVKEKDTTNYTNQSNAHKSTYRLPIYR